MGRPRWTPTPRSCSPPTSRSATTWGGRGGRRHPGAAHLRLRDRPLHPEAEVDADTQELLTSDFEIGHYIRERVVPRAVLFFTGEALEEDDFDEEEDDDEDEGEEEGEEEEDDPDFDPSKVKNPQECKQQ